MKILLQFHRRTHSGKWQQKPGNYYEKKNQANNKKYKKIIKKNAEKTADYQL